MSYVGDGLVVGLLGPSPSCSWDRREKDKERTARGGDRFGSTYDSHVSRTDDSSLVVPGGSRSLGYRKTETSYFQPRAPREMKNPYNTLIFLYPFFTKTFCFVYDAWAPGDDENWGPRQSTSLQHSKRKIHDVLKKSKQKTGGIKLSTHDKQHDFVYKRLRTHLSTYKIYSV